MHRILGITVSLALLVRGSAHAQDDALSTITDVLLESRIPAHDDADALAARLLEVAVRHARNPASELLIESAGKLLDDVDQPRALIAGLRRYLAVANAHGLARSAAHAYLGQALRVLGEATETATVAADDEFASELLAVGPFGDGGDFFNGVPFRPELRFPAPDARIEGRFGDVVPRIARRRVGERSVELAPPGHHRDGCWYGLHQIHVARPTAGYVELATRSSFEVFVDGVRVRSVDRVLDRVPQRVHVPIALDPGVHHVLIKTTLEDHHEIALRYVDALGTALPGIEVLSPDRLHPTAELDADATPPVPEAFVDGLGALLRAVGRADAARDSAVAVTAARIAFERGVADAGNELLFSFAQQPPTDPRLLLAIAETWRIAPDVPAEIRDGEARRLLEAVVPQLPAGHHHARLRQVDVLRGDDRLEDAVRTLQAAIADGSGGRQSRDRLVGMLIELGDRAAAVRAQREWLDAHPLDIRPRLALANERARDGGDPRAALELLEAGLAALPGHEGLLGRARSLAIDLGDRDRALRLLDRQYARDPGALAALTTRARTLRELGDRDGAVASWQRCASHSDADAGIFRDVGVALWRAGEDAPATALLRRSLELRPEQHELRRTLGRLGGATSDFPRIARFRTNAAEIDAIAAGFQATERERSAPSTLVIDRMVVEFQPDGSFVREVHQLRRINDLRGVEAHEEATAAAQAGAVVRLRTIAAGGGRASYVPKRVGGTFTMPRLEPGAFIEELWRDESGAPDEAPWRGPSFYFRGEDAAFLLSELVLILPPGHPGSVRERGFPGTPEHVELDGGYEALVFTRRDVPRLRPERMTPPIDELVPVVTFGSDRPVGERQRVARIGSLARTRVTPPVASATRAVIEGVDGDAARALAIHRWVHETIAVERGSPEPTATLLRRQGPRFFLEVAMLRLAGVPVRDALVMDESEAIAGRAPPLFVGDEEFGVPAALVEPRDGEAFWLFVDLPRHAPLGFVPADRAGAGALMASDGELRRLPRASETAPGWSVSGRITLSADGDALFAVRLELRDSPGYGLAQQIRDLDASRRQLVGRNIGAQMFGGWTVVTAEIPVCEPGEHFRAKLELRRRGALQPAGDVLQLALPLPPSQMLQRYGDAGPRELPFRQSGATLEAWDVVVELGDAHRIAGIPADTQVVDPMLDYSLSFARDGAAVRVRRHVRLRPGTLPAGQFPEWLHKLSKIDRAEEARIEVVAR